MMPDNTAHGWALKLMDRGADPATIAAWMRLELSRDPQAFDPAPHILTLDGPDDLDAILADPDIPPGLRLYLLLLAHELQWCSCYRGVTDADEAWLHSQEAS